jgi:hypothetical protein
MKNQRPKEHEYASYVSYGRALEDYCDALEGRPAQPEQEPVAWWDTKIGVFNEKHFDQLQPLYTTPPRREWVGIKAEDLAEIDSDKFWSSGNHMAIAMAVEAKLKEKNNG